MSVLKFPAQISRPSKAALSYGGLFSVSTAARLVANSERKSPGEFGSPGFENTKIGATLYRNTAAQCSTVPESNSICRSFLFSAVSARYVSILLKAGAIFIPQRFTSPLPEAARPSRGHKFSFEKVERGLCPAATDVD